MGIHAPWEHVETSSFDALTAVACSGCDDADHPAVGDEEVALTRAEGRDDDSSLDHQIDSQLSTSKRVMMGTLPSRELETGQCLAPHSRARASFSPISPPIRM